MVAPADSPFPPTRWSIVLQVRDAGDEPAPQAALAELCRGYWYPLYAFARRRGHSPHEAQDLTQGFFAYALARDLFASAEARLGKLRTFLLTTFERYLAGERDRERAAKRGGAAREIVSLDAMDGEARYREEPAERFTPETLYARTWALDTLRTALRDLAEEGGGAQFAILEPFLSPDVEPPSYADAAAQLGLNEDATRQAVSRLRRRFRERLRRQIADTLRDPDEAQVEEELVALRAALRG